jgi:hypothetical protein
MAAAALALVLVAEVALWALVRGGARMTALVASGVFWCLAFPGWTIAGRRWWKASATPDVVLGLTLILMTAACFYAGQGLSDAAYCGSGVYPDRRSACWMSAASQEALVWIGLLNVPVALIAAALATMRTRALRFASEAAVESTSNGAGVGPKPVTALVIAAAILGVALVAFALLLFANIGPPSPPGPPR